MKVCRRLSAAYADTTGGPKKLIPVAKAFYLVWQWGFPVWSAQIRMLDQMEEIL